ncbi:hypothetical protein ISU10_19675 [Nocardioides agariphilus]|uniref:Uncharacterized protein n=1 Tax=Nocardioides agariphilus TaxID=433664 RepID=A0A930VNH0_9ACTN|nr:hypothetical protein [Nocardioides agariphilus]
MRAHAEAPGAPGAPGQGESQPQPSWWHRDHPTFSALTGFFTGLAFVAVVPAVFVGLLHLLVDDETTNDLFPLVLLSLMVPLGLMGPAHTRRFGRYMLIGIVVTALVVGGVASLVVWAMMERDL